MKFEAKFDQTRRSILELSAKPYRSLILDKRLSEIEFRQYLFARQASVLIYIKKLDEFSRRAKSFVIVILLFTFLRFIFYTERFGIHDEKKLRAYSRAKN